MALFQAFGSSLSSRPCIVVDSTQVDGAFPLDCGIEIESSDEKLTAIANVGFYATCSLGESASEGTDLVQTLGDIVFYKLSGGPYRHLYAIDSVRALAKRFVCEMESVHGKIGIVSDVRMRRIDASSKPFRKFHVDVPIVSRLFAQNFYEKFGIDGLTKSALMSLIDDVDGYLYNVNRRVCEELASKAKKDADKEGYGSDGDDTEEAFSPSALVGDQFNCWLQLSDELCAQPTLGLIPKDYFNSIMDAADDNAYCDLGVNPFAGYFNGNDTDVGVEREQKKSLRKSLIPLA